MLTAQHTQTTLDHDGLESARSSAMTLIDTREGQHDVVRQPAPTFRTPAPASSSNVIVLRRRPSACLPGYRRSPNASAHARPYSKNQEIFREGDAAACFYHVVSGVVRTYNLLSDGRRQIDAFHLPGDMFGMESTSRYRRSAEAVGAVTLKPHPIGGLDRLATLNPVQAKQILEAMTRSLERAQDHMMVLGRKSAQEKIASFLLAMADRLSRHGTLDLPMSRVDIADHLGLTIETVSRSLTQFERDHLIALPCARRTIVLRDRAALLHLAG